MSELSKYYKAFQLENPEKFNEDIIFLKEKDNILEKITDACKSLETVEGIKFDGAKYVNERILYKDSDPEKDEYFEVDYEESRLINIEINFTLTKENEENNVETATIKKIISFPRLLDGRYYYINSVKYYPILQIVDAETYKTGQAITMRTSLQPIVIMKKKNTIQSENFGDEIEGYYVFSKIFNVKVPIFTYFFAHMGITETLKFFSLNDWEILEKNEVKNFDDYDDSYLFKIGKMLYLRIPTDYLDNGDTQNKVMVMTFLNTFKAKDKLSIEKIDSLNYWLKKLGSYFTQNTSKFDVKGASVKASFERLFDDTTRRIIRIPEDDKQDIYTLLRWFLINYNNLLSQNNDDLANKRLRLNECFIFPLLDNWTQGVLRILNGKNCTINKLKTLFSNINSDFLVHKCVISDNMRYMNNVNSIDLSNLLKITIAGNQSISNAKGEIRGKTIDVSMLGRVCLVHTSNNDPGTTRMLTPFCKVNDTWHFTNEPNIKAEGFDTSTIIDENEDIDENDLYELEDDNSFFDYDEE